MKAILRLLTKTIQMFTRNWRIATSVLMSLSIFVLAYQNRGWLLEAFATVRETNPYWMAGALGVILLSYFITSQVLTWALRRQGYHLGLVRMWAVGLVAIVISQSVPAGGVGSYAFLVGSFRRRGVRSGQATLVASLEVVSYVSTMIVIFLFSLLFLTARGLATGYTSYFAAGAALLFIAGFIFVLTRSEVQLALWLLKIKDSVAHLLHREWDDTWVLHKVRELAHGRSLFASRRRDVLWLMLIQFAGLSGHSLAMLMVLRGLGVQTNFMVVLASFGIALITSTFNVLPGGGGTVEAALITILTQLGIGVLAVPAAIIFRLFNFWLMLPLSAVCYYWLVHEPYVQPDSTMSIMPTASTPSSEYSE